MKDVVLDFVERGLRAPPRAMEPPPPEARELPTLGGTASLPSSAWSNAGLFEVLDNPLPERSAGEAPRG